jgi:hypothetical protein
VARIRTIKPEYWSDELIASWPHISRLAYIALWNESDDAGRLRANPLYLKAHLFPYDADLDMGKALAPIVESGRLVVYSVDGQAYGFLPNFREHQVINRPAPSRLPAPPSEGLTGESVDTPGGITDDSVSIPGLFPELSVRTHPGKEWKGMDIPRGSEDSMSRFPAFWSLYPKKVGKADTEREWKKLTDAEREKAIQTVPVYAASGRVADGFVQDPRRWLHAKTFNDDPAGWKGNGKAEKPDPTRRAVENIKARRAAEAAKREQEKPAP